MSLVVWLRVGFHTLICIFSFSPCQTRDDFLGQVDVPLNQIPVSLHRKTTFDTHLFEVDMS